MSRLRRLLTPSRMSFLSLGMGLGLLTSVLLASRSVSAVDFGGNQTGSTLTAVDKVFRFLADITGTFTVKADGGDTLDFTALPQGITLNLSAGTGNQTLYPGLIISFQGPGGYTIQLTNFDDHVTGSPENDNLNGIEGNDILNGGDGDDAITGGNGNDTINGGNGDDEIFGQAGNDTISGEEGSDYINGASGDDTLSGGTGGDQIYGGEGNDFIDGSAGDDEIHGEDGSDTLFGGSGNDIIDGGDANGDVRGDFIAENCVGDSVTAINYNNCPKTIPDPTPGPTPLPTPAPTPAPAGESHPETSDLCITRATRVALVKNVLVVYSDFTNTPNGMIITQIPVTSLRAPSDEEKASQSPVPLAYKDSEFAPGWSVGVYWQNSHYGFLIYKDGGQTLYDNTDAICGWF